MSKQTTKAPKVARQKKTRTEKNERRKSKRIEKQRNSSKPPRSPNRFILYRKHIQNRINTDPNNPANMRDLSKMVAQMWERETPEVKQYWDQVAERIKLNSSYRSSFDVINGLDMSISESDITDITFVNATASPSQSAKSKKNRKNKSHTSSNTFNPTISAESFIIESPELSIPQIPPSNSSNPQWPLSPLSSQSSLSPPSPLSPLSPLSPQSPQSPLFSHSPLPSLFPPLQYQIQTPQTPQSPQFQYLQSPQLTTDEDPSLVPPPPPLNDDDYNFSYDQPEIFSYTPPYYNLSELFSGSIVEHLIEPEPDYFIPQP